MPTLTVRPDGTGDFRSIQAAVDQAGPLDVIRVAAGTYREAVSVDVDRLRLLAEGAVTITNGGSFGMRVDADGVFVRGFTVTGILGTVFPADHAATGFVVTGANVRLKDNVAHGNGVNGFLVADTARNVTIEGGAAYDNTFAGVAVAGGRAITLDGIEIYNTGLDGGPDGTFQRTGVLTDNVGDTARVNGEIRDVDGIQPIRGLTMRNLEVHDHPGYGIRVSAFNAALSPLPSGRITTTDVTLLNSHVARNGSALDDWVGGLYHLGGVLLQHVSGGLVRGNVVEDNYHWGIDAYASDRVIYADNWLIGNDRGMATAGVTFEPVGLEINGGSGNRVWNNLVVDGASGLFSSSIPDTGDGFAGSASVGIRNNILFGNSETDLALVGENDVFTRVIENNVVGFLPDWLLTYIGNVLHPDFLDTNLYGVDPGFVDAAGGDYSLAPHSPIVNLSIGPRFPALEAGARSTHGTAGPDHIRGGPFPDGSAGRGGDDRLTGGTGWDTLVGERGDDSLYGGPNGDIARGGSGEDSVRGGRGDDTLTGDGGRDTLFGDEGDDRAHGGAGSDVILGRGGHDTLAGQGDGDVLRGGSGADHLHGQGGDDTLFGGGGHDTLAGGSGEDVLLGDFGRDLLVGQGDDDALAGGGGRDRLIGGAGNDRLAGGPGGDRIAGGPDHDTLRGGSGPDDFLFRPGDGDDVIVDFDPAVDRIALAGGLTVASFDFAPTDGGTSTLMTAGTLSIRIAGVLLDPARDGDLFI